MANKKPVYYCQWDSKWGNIPYTIDGDTTTETIGKSGCGPTSMAMVLSTWIDKGITPVDTCKLAISMKDRTANNGTSWTFFKHIADKYKLKFVQTATTDIAVKALKNGAYVVCSMGPGYFTKHGHFILAWNVDKTNIYVNDPNNQAKDRASIELFRQQCVQYFIFYPPSNAVKTTEKSIATIQTNKDVQTALNTLGYNSGEVDGIIGARTIIAITKFQEKTGLKPDGMPNKNTKAKLQELINR